MTAGVVVFGVVLTTGFNPGRLVTFSNYSAPDPTHLSLVAAETVGLVGSPLEAAPLLAASNVAAARITPDVWPHTNSVAWLFLLGLLLPAYTLTGFDAAAQTSEETIDAARAVPRGIVQAVFMSGIAGYIMLVAIVLAAPDLDRAAAAGNQSF